MAFVRGTYLSDLLDTRDGVTSGVDVIYGYGGNDRIFAYGGNDRILGGYGADYIDGGNDIDTADYVDSDVWVSLASGEGYSGTAAGDTLYSIENLSGSYHDDLLIGNDGANLLAGNYGNDILKGGGGADRIVAGEGDDTLEGGAGDDLLEGGLGKDSLSGGTGNDTYNYVGLDDVVMELADGGYDVVFSGDHAYTLTANVETLSMAAVGSRGVYGTGNAQANTIYGNAGDNVLEGGGGRDALSGLGGNDNFVFRPRDANGDVIYDFQGNGTGVGDFMYFIGYGTAAQGASFVQLSATTWQINSADGVIHDVITFSGSGPINSGDFVFI